MSPLTLLVVSALCVADREGAGLSSPPPTPPQHWGSSGVSGSTTSNNSGGGCSEEDQASCPPGLYCQNGQCHCNQHNRSNIIRCTGTTSSSLLNCYCATWDESTNSTAMGHCLYNCGTRIELKKGSEMLYSPLPRNVSQLNQACLQLNRTGTLCGRCREHHFPMAYSFNWTCIPCPQPGLDWLRYLLAAYLPLTLFCVCVLFFQLNVASSHLYPAIVFCQALAMPVTMRVWLSSYLHHNPNIFSQVSMKLVASLYGVWNLDFFRPFYTDLCLGLGVLPTLALDYAIAVYPLLLTLLTYLLIFLHDRNCRLLRLAWRCCRGLRKEWSGRTSVIDAFATFFLLSNIKLLSVCFDLLVPTTVLHLHGADHTPTTTGLYYAPDVAYFGKEHLPYAILSIVVLCMFVVLPTIVLLLYPFSCFQRLLNHCPARWYILHTFMDSFQGCYRDRTEPGNTWDCRWVSSLYFLMRLLLFVIYSTTLTVLFFSVAGILVILAAFLILVIRPFKSPVSHFNWIHAVFVLLLGLDCVSVSGMYLSTIYSPTYTRILYAFTALLCVSPLMYIVAFVCYWVFKKRQCVLKLVSRLRARKKGYDALLESSADGGLLDRV